MTDARFLAPPRAGDPDFLSAGRSGKPDCTLRGFLCACEVLASFVFLAARGVGLLLHGISGG